MRTWLSMLMAGAVLAGLTGTPSVRAQDNPFADPEAPAAPPEVDDPFADVATPTPRPTAWPAVQDPFADTTSATPTPRNPFEDTSPRTGTAPSNTAPRSGTSTRTLPARDDEEVRGVWVLSSDRGFQGPQEVEELAKAARDGRLTRVYVETRTPLGLSYISTLEETLPVVTVSYANPLGDLKTRLPRQTRMIAVVSLLPAYPATAAGGRPPARNVMGKFPELTNLDITGNPIAPDNYMHLDPGHPGTVNYLSAIVTEIANEINPDGYLFTNFSYPGNEWGYSPEAVRAFRETVGGMGNPPTDDPIWSAWRRDKVQQLLASLTRTVKDLNPNVRVGALIEVQGPPPGTWPEYLSSPLYAGQMVDWIRFGKESAVDELVFEVHERTLPQGNILRDWVSFAGNNSYRARPIISLAGMLNFSTSLTRQIEQVRSRGLGSVIYHYAQPVRDPSRGFWDSLPNVMYRGRPGRFVAGRQLLGAEEPRRFTRLLAPPPAVVAATATPTPVVDLVGSQPLVFATPTPIPTRTPVPKYVPESIVRRITLGSGTTVDAVVLELTPDTITIKEGENAPMVLSRSAIRSIEPSP